MRKHRNIQGDTTIRLDTVFVTYVQAKQYGYTESVPEFRCSDLFFILASCDLCGLVGPKYGCPRNAKVPPCCCSDYATIFPTTL